MGKVRETEVEGEREGERGRERESERVRERGREGGREGSSEREGESVLTRVYVCASSTHSLVSNSSETLQVDSSIDGVRCKTAFDLTRLLTHYCIACPLPTRMCTRVWIHYTSRSSFLTCFCIRHTAHSTCARSAKAIEVSAKIVIHQPLN